jgi:hypothetical protein
MFSTLFAEQRGKRGIDYSQIALLRFVNEIWRFKWKERSSVKQRIFSIKHLWDCLPQPSATKPKAQADG